MKGRISWVAVVLFVGGCSKAPDVESPPTEAISRGAGVESAAGAPEGDFRGHRWGEQLSAVSEREGKRSQAGGDEHSFATELAGYPVELRLLGLRDRFAGARYQFPWPGEVEACREVMEIGSECSLRSAAYAVEVCNRMIALLTEKYQLVAADGTPRDKPAISSAESLDRSLRWKDPSGMTFVDNQWSGERISVFQMYEPGRVPGRGWRCTLSYRSTPEIETQIDQELTQSEDEAAAKDL